MAEMPFVCCTPLTVSAMTPDMLMYGTRTVSNDYPADKPFDFDMIVLFTPAGVESLLKNFPNFDQGETRLACFGPATKKAMEDAGLRCDLSAPTPEARSMTTAIEMYLEKAQSQALLYHKSGDEF